MASHDYHFITRWHILDSSIDEISDVLADGPSLARWWPSVYLQVQQREPGDPDTAVGRIIDLYTKGWLPYTLR